MCLYYVISTTCSYPKHCIYILFKAHTGAKEETSSLCIQDQPRTGSTKDKGQDTAFVDIYDPSATDNVIQNHKVELVRVKVENKEAENSSSLLGSSSCHFDSVREAHFCPDSLSLVQSKMLEEWRPDALDMRSSDPQSPGTSHTLCKSLSVLQTYIYKITHKMSVVVNRLSIV